MDDGLNERWRKSECPFDGDVVSVSLFDPAAARLVVARVARDLRVSIPDEELFSQWDFHGRDGFVSSLSNVSWSELEFASRSDAAFLDRLEASPGMCRLWVPASFRWMLRWGVDEFGTIRVDVVADDRTLSLVSLFVSRSVDAEVVRRKARTFFDSTWKLTTRSGVVLPPG
jgi:hypothetical protein